jgi:hypothetical protein
MLDGGFGNVQGAQKANWKLCLLGYASLRQVALQRQHNADCAGRSGTVLSRWQRVPLLRCLSQELKILYHTNNFTSKN